MPKILVYRQNKHCAAEGSIDLTLPLLENASFASDCAFIATFLTYKWVPVGVLF